MNIKDMINYFCVLVPQSLCLKYPEQNGAIVKWIIEKEIADPAFLSADKMCPYDRAQFAISTIGGHIDNDNMTKAENKSYFKFMVNKFLLVAEMLILNHRLLDHSDNSDPINIKRREYVDYMLKQYELTPLEKEMINPTTNGWLFEPVKNAEKVYTVTI